MSIPTSRRESLLNDEEMTSDMTIGGRKVLDYSSAQFRHCRQDHNDGTLVGYVLRLTVADGEILRRGLPDQNGFYIVGYDVDSVDGSNQYGEVRRISKSHQPDVVVADRVYACGCRVN